MRTWIETTFPGGRWQSGGDYLVSSPLREDRHPSFAISPEKRCWHDYATGEHGLLSELCRTLGIEEPSREGRAQALPAHPEDREARQLWEKGVPAKEHAYAARKGFPLDGLRVNPANGELLIPQRDPHTGELSGVERISRHADKDGKYPKFQTGKRGGIFRIGSTDGSKPILVSEGLSTGYSLHRLTNWPVYVAFSAPQLAGMYQTVRYLHPDREIAVCPDCDEAGRKGADLAAALGASVVTIPEGSREKDDWLDLEQRHGSEIVKQKFQDQWQTRRKRKEPASEKPVFQLHVMSAKDLYSTPLRSPSWSICQLIPEGLSVLASPPKTGKSFFVLQAALAVASGRPFLGQRTTKGRVLILSLEDTYVRLQKRLAQVCPDTSRIPANLDLTVEFPRLDEEGLAVLESYIRDKRPRLTVCDTWGKLKPAGQAKRGENVYETDVRLVSEVKKLADRYETSILLVHHLKKGGSREGDWLESLSGSMGLSATVDGLLAIERERGSDVGVLKRSGRDLEDDEDIGLKWTSPGWEYSGDAKQMMASAARKGILSSIARAREPVTPAYIAADTQQNANTVRWHLMRMVSDNLVTRTSDNKYMIPMPQEESDEKTNSTNGTNSTNRTNATNRTNSTNTANVSNETNDDLGTNGEKYSDCNGLQDSSLVGVGGVGLGTNSINPSDSKGLAHCVGGVGGVGANSHVDEINNSTPGNLEKFFPLADRESESIREKFRMNFATGATVDMITGEIVPEPVSAPAKVEDEPAPRVNCFLEALKGCEDDERIEEVS
jgi:hypothetical protein